MKTDRSCFTPRGIIFCAALLLLTGVWAAFHSQINRQLDLHFFLNASSPREEAFSELADRYHDPLELLNRCWATGKVTHRALVASFLKAHAFANPNWLKEAEPLLLAGSVDADSSVRELSLGALEAERNPHLFDAAQGQLTDVDPMVRLTGLNYLRKTDTQHGVPIFMSLLDDPDLRIVAAAEVALTRWTGQDYGVRARLAIAPQEGAQAGKIEPGNVEAIQKGVGQRKQWWQVHAKEFPAPSSWTSEVITVESNRAPAVDFRLNDINGNTFHLHDLRGKAVLLNFWATWCPACIAEIPDLVALQKEHGRDIVVVGVSLDGVPDEEGEQEEAQGQDGKPARSVKAIQTKVANVAHARGINYTVLLDPHGSVGGQYNGGELPTTVLIDKEGKVRRRFIGDRSPAILAAMISQVQ